MTKFTDLLLTADFIKAAGPDNPSKMQLEEDFGRVAYTFLTDRAPQLIEHLLGFETVEQDPDGTRAVGIFGFKLGDAYYYVPVFFINNQIKGMDLLFNKTNNTFIPLQESWILYILNKQSVSLGEGVSNNKDIRQDLSAPDFGFLRDAPGTAKMASAKDIIHDGFNTWNMIQEKIAEAFNSDKDFQEAFAGAIYKLGKNKDLSFYKTASSKLIDFLQDAGGPSAVKTVINSLDNYKYANAAATFYDVDSLVVSEFSEKLAPKVAADKLKITVNSYDYDSPAEDRKRIVEYGFTIKDVRDDSEKSDTLPSDYSKTFTSPEEPGLYNLLLSNGGTVEAWIFTPHQPHSDYVIAYEPNSELVITAGTNSLVVRDNRIEKSKTPFDSAIKLDAMKLGKRYILINDKLHTSAIFVPSMIRASSSTRTEIEGRFSTGVQYKARTSDDVPSIGGTLGCDTDTDTIQLVDFDSDKLNKSGDKLIVPANWKALELSDDDSYELRGVFKPGSLADLDTALFKNALHKLTIESPDGGIAYYVKVDDTNEGPYTLKEAAWRLASGLRLDANKAFTILDDARTNLRSSHILKAAQGVGVSMPMPMPPQYGMDPYTGARTERPDEQLMQGQMTGIPPLDDPMRQGIAMGGQSEADVSGGGLQSEVMQLAEQAAQSGQKNVFDHSTIAGLAKVYDVSGIVDIYMPDMFKALDRLGRVLFLFYWKNDEFADRYGISDLTAMEDNLRSVFKNYGDLVLQLKEKTIDSSIDGI